MTASLVPRSTVTDDDGSGTTGSIWNNSEVQKIYDNIDLLISGTGSYTQFELGGALKVDGVTDLAGYKETNTSITVTSNTITINLLLGSSFDFQATANITTTTIQNIAAAGKVGSFVLRVKGDGSARTWAWFDSTVKWSFGAVPTRTSTNNKYDHFLFETRDGGTTWAGYVIGQSQDA